MLLPVMGACQPIYGSAGAGLTGVGETPFSSGQVGSADAGLVDADEDVVDSDDRLRDVGQPEAGFTFAFDEGFHGWTTWVNCCVGIVCESREACQTEFEERMQTPALPDDGFQRGNCGRESVHLPP